MYALGQGVKKNLVQAYMWASVMATQADRNAQTNAKNMLDAIAPLLTAAQIAEA